MAEWFIYRPGRFWGMAPTQPQPLPEDGGSDSGREIACFKTVDVTFSRPVCDLILGSQKVTGKVLA